MTRILPKCYEMSDVRPQTGYRTTKIIPKKYGFIVHRFSDYVSLQFIKIVYNDNGFSKATVKVRTNYRTPYQYTLYFDNMGDEIHADTTMEERKLWLKAQEL